MDERSDRVGLATKWIGALLILAAGVIVLLGGLGLHDHPLRNTFGVVLLGYGGIRVLLNVWWMRRRRQSQNLR